MMPAIIMNTKNINYSVEYTDTFGGEPNYAWVRRTTIQAPADISNRALMRRAKRALGISGLRGRTIWDGDMLEFRPYRCCTVLFIIPEW